MAFKSAAPGLVTLVRSCRTSCYRDARMCQNGTQRCFASQSDDVNEEDKPQAQEQSSEGQSRSKSSDFRFLLNPDLEDSTPSKSSETKPVPGPQRVQQDVPKHTYREPAPLLSIPEDIRPRFRMPVKRRPDPVLIDDLWAAVKRTAKGKFDESIDVSVSLMIDPRKSDQLIRGSTTLPHGTGKDKRVAVFARGADAEAARQAGAILVGDDELIKQVAQDKGIAADVIITTPDMMPALGKVARILGPRGLMPNPKMGTITTDVKEAVRQQRMGKVQFRNDKGGVVSATIGRSSFPDEKLTTNFYTLFNTLMDMRPKGVKGTDLQGYVKRVSVSTTQGKGLPIATEELQISKRSLHATG